MQVRIALAFAALVVAAPFAAHAQTTPAAGAPLAVQDSAAAAPTPAPVPAAAPAVAAPTGAPAPEAAPAAPAPATKAAPGAGTVSPAGRSSAYPTSSLLQLAQPLWSDLSAPQRDILSPLEQQWNSLSSVRKQAWIQLANRIPRMEPDQRERALERMREWATLSPEKRALARANFRLAKRLPGEERIEQWKQYENLSAEERDQLRKAPPTSNTAARHAGSASGLAKQAAQPLATPPKASPPKAP